MTTGGSARWRRPLSNPERRPSSSAPKMNSRTTMISKALPLRQVGERIDERIPDLDGEVQVRSEAASGVTDTPDDRPYVDLLADTHDDAREVAVPARQSFSVVQPHGKAPAVDPTRHENGPGHGRSDAIPRDAVDVKAFVEAVPRQALAEELGDRTVQRPRPDRGSLRRYRPRPDRDLQVRTVCDDRSRKTRRQHGDPGEGALGDGDRTRSRSEE